MPKKEFEVIGVDTFDGTDVILGRFKTLEEAKAVANEKGGTMFKTHVYDKNGQHVYEAGTF